MYVFCRVFFKYCIKSLYICINWIKIRIELYIILNGVIFLKWIIVYYNVYIKISFVVLKIVYFSEILIY